VHSCPIAAIMKGRLEGTTLLRKRGFPHEPPPKLKSPYFALHKSMAAGFATAIGLGNEALSGTAQERETYVRLGD